MKVSRFHGCPPVAMEIRQKVFVEEQGFCDEFDQIDGIAEHFVLLDSEKPVGTCRVFQGELPGVYILGRLAVLTAYRGSGLGRRIVEEAELYLKEVGAKELRLHAQCRVAAFYKKLGYEEFGDVELEENCPHIWMKKAL